MAEQTKIQWCHHTFNPWRGCTKVSAGCAHCYAETQSKRNPKALGVWGKDGVRVVGTPNYWRQAYQWNRDAYLAKERRHVFCASLADVFEDWKGPVQQGGLPMMTEDETIGSRLRPTTLDDARLKLFVMIEDLQHLDWLLLTKRPENIVRMIPEKWRASGGMPLNVWLGASVEDQAAADERIPHLLKCPATVRFLSCEPLIGPLRLPTCPHGNISADPGIRIGQPYKMSGDSVGIQWVIVGGESGPRARPCQIEWVRSIVAQCNSAGVPVFVKQLGKHIIVDAATNLRVLMDDSHGGDMEEWTTDLRVREFPAIGGRS